MTNPGIVELQRTCTNSRQVSRSAESAVWTATGPDISGQASVYVAFFRFTGSGPVSVALADLGLKGSWSVKDVWAGSVLPYVSAPLSCVSCGMRASCWRYVPGTTRLATNPLEASHLAITRLCSKAEGHLSFPLDSCSTHSPGPCTRLVQLSQ